jgi:hypothetical protein
MAREFVTQNPPTSPIMALYCEHLADFIAAFPPAASVPYLADMARLEYAMLTCLHCADSQPISTDRLVHLVEDQEALAHTGVKLAPAVKVLSSNFAIASLWHAHQGNPAVDLSQITLDQPETVLLSRPEWEVELHIIDAGAAEFIHRLNQATPLAQATDTAQPFDPVAVLQLLIQQQAITDLIDHSLSEVPEHE